MIYQMHLQDVADLAKTEWVAQSDNFEADDTAAFRLWCVDVRDRHPLPAGKQWLVCSQESSHFVCAAPRS